ncbi:MAG: hypothetical protein ABEN55_11905 [Bradymonadaceae bacterium]
MSITVDGETLELTISGWGVDDRHIACPRRQVQSLEAYECSDTRFKSAMPDERGFELTLMTDDEMTTFARGLPESECNRVVAAFASTVYPSDSDPSDSTGEVSS